MTTPVASRPFRVHPVTLAVLAGMLAITVLATVISRSSHQDTEDRLLAQRVEAAGAVFSGALPGLFAPLMGAATLAEETHGDRAALRRYLRSQVGEGGPYQSLSIWEVGADDPLLVVGTRPQLAGLPVAERREVLERTATTEDVAVVDLLDAAVPAVGFAGTAAPPDVRYVVYAENALPPDRTSMPQEESPFRDLDYALYLGDERRADRAIVASTPDLPLAGRTDQTVLPFGDQELLLVLRPKGHLAGEMSARRPWVVLAIGTVFGLALAGLVEALRRRQEAAEALAAENLRLYEEQRTVAHVVQQSLLPADLPAIPGVEIEVRYRPGVAGTEVGGDWYDVVWTGPDRVLVVVGDVAGRGLKAATVMAALRHAIRAYAIDGDDPTVLPGKLTPVIDLEGAVFATVLLFEVQPSTRRVRVVSAGHPPPLLVDGEGSFVPVPVGPPVGVGDPDRVHGAIEVTLPPGAILLGYTDGLVERRNESIDDGLERLRSAVVADQPLAAVLDQVVDALAGPTADDDLALVGIRA